MLSLGIKTIGSLGGVFQSTVSGEDINKIKLRIMILSMEKEILLKAPSFYSEQVEGVVSLLDSMGLSNTVGSTLASGKFILDEMNTITAVGGTIFSNIEYLAVAIDSCISPCTPPARRKKVLTELVAIKKNAEDYTKKVMNGVINLLCISSGISYRIEDLITFKMHVDLLEASSKSIEKMREDLEKDTSCPNAKQAEGGGGVVLSGQGNGNNIQDNADYVIGGPPQQ